MESKRIGTFKEYLNEQRQLKLKESNVEIDVEWWDQCIEEVMALLEGQAGSFTWENLVDYVKRKFQILGRTLPVIEHDLVLQHIKDLIFQLHGESFYDDNTSCGSSYIHTMGLVVQQLANLIMDKVAAKTNGDMSTTRVLIDDATTCTSTADETCDGEYYEDLPWEYASESKNTKKVKGFKEFSKPLNEEVAIIGCDDNEACIEYCLDRIKKEVGGLDPDDILNVAIHTIHKLVRARVVRLYVRDLALDYFSQNGFSILRSEEDSIPEDVIKQAVEALSWDLSDDVLVRIAEENGMTIIDGKDDEEA